METIHACTPQEILPAFAYNNIPIVLTLSNCYAPYAGVFIRSMMDHSSENCCYDIIIMEHDISPENKRLLLDMVSGHGNFSVRFYDSRQILEEWNMVAVCDRFRIPEILIRLFLPHLLDHYDRIVMTGVDMLLKRDIAELFELDLNDMYVGAVRDVVWQGHFILNIPFKCSENKMPVRDYWEKELRTRVPLDYVNADLVLFDCKKFREKRSVELISSMVVDKKYMMDEQDIINIILADRIYFLNQAWNCMLPLNVHEERSIAVLPEDTKVAYQQAILAPALLHWSGKPKPWVCPDVPYGNEWWETAMRTPFMGHILARMFDELQTRREYYRERYHQEVQVWNPVPNVDRSKDHI